MLTTEAIITNIDYNSNVCFVRVPIFENPNYLEQTTMEGRILIQPGTFNEYKVNDLVWVTFVDNKINMPLVIGKIYQGPEYEKSITGGVLQKDSLKVVSSAELPKNTTFTNIGSISDIMNYIKTLEQRISTLEQKNK